MLCLFVTLDFEFEINIGGKVNCRGYKYVLFMEIVYVVVRLPVFWKYQ